VRRRDDLRAAPADVAKKVFCRPTRRSHAAFVTRVNVAETELVPVPRGDGDAAILPAA